MVNNSIQKVGGKLTIYGYARVSTQGQNLEEQTEQLLNAGVELENLYSEKQTGKTTNREAFQEVLGKLQTNDQLVITKLDRFARNTKEALEIIEPLLEKGVSIKVLNLGTIENTTMGRMIVRTLLSVAEMERDMILERTQAGKEYARKHNPNYREGRPKAVITPKKKHAYELLMEGKTYKEVEALTGFSKSTLQRIKRQLNEEEAR